MCRFAYVKKNYLYEQRFQDQVFIIIRTQANAAQKSLSSQPFQTCLENTLPATPLSRKEFKGKITLCLSEKLNVCFPLRYANQMKLTELFERMTLFA